MSACPETGPATAPARLPIGLLIMIGMIGPMTIHMIVPALPGLLRYFGTDYVRIQLLVSAFIVIFGLSQIVVGPLADRFGRRRVLLVGLGVFVAASAAAALAPTVEILIALRMLQGASGCVGIVTSRAIIRDSFGDRDSVRMLGYLATGIAIAPMLSPIAGGVIYELAGWRAIFWFIAAFAATGLVFSSRLLPETRPDGEAPRSAGQMAVDLRKLVTNRSFQLYGANICLNTGMFYSFVVGAPYVVALISDLTPSAYGAWFATAAAGYAIGNLASSRLSGRFDRVTLAFAGSVLTCAAVLLLLIMFASDHGTVGGMFAIFSAATLASGLLMPSSLSGVLAADPSRAGSASGFIGFAQFACAAIFSAATGYALETQASALPMILIMLTATTAGLCSATAIRLSR